MPPDIRDVIAANLARAMEHAGVSQAQLAHASRVAQSSISRALRRQNSPNADTLAALAKPLGLQGWQLMVPNLDPTNPPVIALSQAERDLYERFAQAARQLTRSEK